MPLSSSIKFDSEAFDYKSTLPEEYNAGNRFYGRDVAEYLASRLTEKGFSSSYLDEDWGWLVFNQKGTTPDFEVAIYNLAEHGEGNKPGIGRWGLWIRAYERKRLLGVLPKRVNVAVPELLLSAVKTAIRAAGANPTQWEAGPGDA